MPTLVGEFDAGDAQVAALRNLAGYDRLLEAVLRSVPPVDEQGEDQPPEPDQPPAPDRTTPFGYRDRVIKALDDIEVALEGRPEPGASAISRAFTLQLYNAALLLAVAYPICWLLAYIFITGEPAPLIGEQVLGPNDPPFFTRLLAGGALVLMLFLLALEMQARRTDSPLRLRDKLIRPIASGLVVGIFAFVFNAPVEGVAAIAFFVVVVRVVEALLVSKSQLNVPGLIAIVFAVAAAIEISTYGGEIAEVLSHATLATLAVGLIFVWVQTRIHEELGLALASALVFVAVTYVALGAQLALPTTLSPDDPFAQEGAEMIPTQMRRAMIVYLAVFPALNGVFDFFSIAMTRYFLRIGARAGAWRMVSFACVDLVFGCLVFIALTFTSVAAIDAFRVGGLNDAPLIDVAALLSDIEAAPGSYWWLIGTYSVALLPALLHAVFAARAVFDTYVLHIQTTAAEAIAMANGPTKRQLIRRVDRQIQWASLLGFFVGVCVVSAVVAALFYFFGSAYLGALKAFAS